MKSLDKLNRFVPEDALTHRVRALFIVFFRCMHRLRQILITVIISKLSIGQCKAKVTSLYNQVTDLTTKIPSRFYIPLINALLE